MSRTVLTTWGCVGVGDVVCPAPGAEWEVVRIEPAPYGGLTHIMLKRGEKTVEQKLSTNQPVYILDKVTAAAERDGVDVAEVAAGVLTSGGLAPSRIDGVLFCDECTIDEDPRPWCDCATDEKCKGPCRNRAHDPARCPNRVAAETVAPLGQTGAAILATCEACGALTYPSQAQRHTDWHVTIAHLIADVHTEVFGS